MTVNRVTLVGNLGQDPKVRFLESGTALCTFSVATKEQRPKEGQEPKVEWHNVVAWARLAEVCGEHLKKGRQVYIEGRIQSREYEVEGQKRRAYEIVAQTVQFLGGPSRSSSDDLSSVGTQPPLTADDVPW